MQGLAHAREAQAGKALCAQTPPREPQRPTALRFEQHSGASTTHVATHESAIPSITLWLLQAPVPSVRRQHEHSEGLRRLSCVRAEFLELWDNAVPRDTPPLQVEALKEESRALSRRLTTGAISQQKQSETEGAVTREEPSQSPAMLPVTTTERVAAATATSSDRAAVSPTVASTSALLGVDVAFVNTSLRPYTVVS